MQLMSDVLIGLLLLLDYHIVDVLGADCMWGSNKVY